AGGSGTRFWPQSTQKKPKQFLNLFGDHTMLQTTVDRIEELIPAERIWVITNDRYVDLVNEQLPDVPTDNIVGEAVAKNTAPCVALAALLFRNVMRKLQWLYCLRITLSKILQPSYQSCKLLKLKHAPEIILLL